MLVDGKDYKKEFSQGFKFTTNNRMELMAVIVALETIKIKNSNVSIFRLLLAVFRSYPDRISRPALSKASSNISGRSGVTTAIMSP